MHSSPSLIVTVILIWISHFLVDVMIGIWPVYKTMAGLDLAIAGMIAGGSAFIGEGLQAVFGTLSDRGYRKTLILSGLFATAAGSFLAYTEDYRILFLLFLTVCVGSGAFHPCAASLVGELTEKRKGLLITIFASGGTLGMAFSQVLFSNAFYFFEGNTAFLAIPTVIIVAAVLLYGLKNPAVTSVQRKKIGFSTFIEFFKNQDLRRLYITQLCNQSILWGTIFLLPDVLKSREYDSWIYLGGGHLFFVLGGFLMMVPGGYLADKYSCRNVILTASVVGFFAFYTLLFFPMLPDHLLLATLLVLGASMCLVNPIAIAFGNKLMPGNPGAISAFLMGLVWFVSEGIGQAGGGMLTKLFEEDAPAKALGILGGMFYITFLLGRKLPNDVKISTFEEPSLEQVN